eukprot:COSAG02_NODE_12121_length_1592_cov_11.405894_2_plen_160_part_00
MTRERYHSNIAVIPRSQFNQKIAGNFSGVIFRRNPGSGVGHLGAISHYRYSSSGRPGATESIYVNVLVGKVTICIVVQELYKSCTRLYNIHSKYSVYIVQHCTTCRFVTPLSRGWPCLLQGHPRDKGVTKRPIVSARRRLKGRGAERAPLESERLGALI